MDNKDYINFDEAVDLLKTTRSTLYKWLQAGKVPGHKLGRQWRFRKDELLGVMNNQESEQQLRTSMTELEQLLDKRSENRKEVNMAAQNIGELAEKLLWDAAQSNATDLHLQPLLKNYQLSYRNLDGMEHISQIDRDLFDALNSYWYQISSPSNRENRRRFHLISNDQVNEHKSLQVITQQLETVQGSRLSLRLIPDWRMKLPLNRVINDETELKTFAEWFKQSHGIIIISGQHGSGKTTTVYSALQDLIDGQRIVFTLEESVHYMIGGANQVEVDFQDSTKVSEAFDAIYNSDPDVIYFDLCGSSKAARISQELAVRSASSGHLVILQMEANSAKEAIEKLSQIPNAKEQIIGASWQELKPHPSGKGRICELHTLTGDKYSKD